MPSIIDQPLEPKSLNGAFKVNGITSPALAVDIDKEMRNPSYPTRSLNFLKNVKTTQEQDSRTHDTTSSAVCLRVLIVGAGLGGLATAIALARKGHKVEVLEAASALGEVGAGIQIPSNSSRLLLEWGLGPFLANKVVEPDGMTFRRWQDGNAIAYTKLIPNFRVKHKAPYYVVHRADFHDAMHQLALQLGVSVLVGHQVVKYNEATPSVTLSNGRVLGADLVVAADGIKSTARKYIPGLGDFEPQETGFAAYRATVDTAKMKEDPDTAWLVEKPCLNLWIGAGQHVMTYTMSSGKSFNMVLSHIDRSDPRTWTAETAVKDMRRYYHDWDPQLVKVINMVDKTMKWPLLTVPTQNRWLSDSGKLLLLGDAVHAMVPYMSQGAAMAVEDGAALAEAISHARTAADLPYVLSVWQKVRVLRSGQMQQASLINGKLWHFADGPEQEARDLAMQPEVLGLPFDESPNQWSDPVTADWAYGYDAVEAVARELRTAVSVKEAS